MEIVSSLLPAVDGVVLLALDSRVDGRDLFVGLGQGSFRNGEVLLSEVGQRCLDRLGAHCEQQSAGGGVHMVEIKRFNRVDKRMREAFTAAQGGDMVFFVCGDGAIYDAVFEKLNIQMRPGAFTAH